MRDKIVVMLIFIIGIWFSILKGQSSTPPGMTRLSATEVFNINSITYFRYSRLTEQYDEAGFLHTIRTGGDIVAGGTHIGVTPEAEDEIALKLGISREEQGTK